MIFTMCVYACHCAREPESVSVFRCICVRALNGVGVHPRVRKSASVHICAHLPTCLTAKISEATLSALRLVVCVQNRALVRDLSLSLSLCLSVSLSLSLSISLSLYLSLSLSLSLFLPPSLPLSVSPPSPYSLFIPFLNHISIHLCLHPSIHPSLFLNLSPLEHARECKEIVPKSARKHEHS